MRFMTQEEKARLFLELHRTERPLILPNAWDVASARIFEDAGFPALATTSAGVANALGYADGERIPRHEMLEVVARIARAVAVPVTADMEAGYGDAAGTARGVIEAGAVGFNIEDRNNPANQIAALTSARQACDRHGVSLVINARIDMFLSGELPADAVNVAAVRLNSYAQSGAQCVFAPGVRDEHTIAALVAAVPHPLNILLTAGSPSIARLRELGVARTTIGSGAMRAAMGLTRRIAQQLRHEESFAAMLDGAMPYVEANTLFLNERRGAVRPQ